MREGGQYSISIFGQRGAGTSRFSAERLLQKRHLFASGDAKSSNTDVISIFTIWQETSGKKQTSSSGKKHLTRNISKESGHCLASQLLLRIEWSQLAHINSAACCLVGGSAVSQSQCRAAAYSSDGHHPRLEKLWLMFALPKLQSRGKGSATSAMNFEL